ncbi:MAG: proteasome ATPase, partial [Bifidobacteriales bacterium]|nr:proteasome ATPase [Bifidobacteriales bacterium]
MQSDDVEQAEPANDQDQAADRRNRALATALTRAAKELSKVKSQLAQLGQPPLTVSLALGVDSVAYDSQGVQQARLLILNGSRRMVVPLAPDIHAERIRAGQEVLLNADMVVVRVGDQPVTGQVRTLRETLESGALLVEDSSGQTRVVARAGSLQDHPIEVGSALLMDEICSIALAVLPDS